jgi:hypothetical protein
MPVTLPAKRPETSKIQRDINLILDWLLTGGTPTAGDADTVDLKHASDVATAHKLLALDANAMLPADITGNAATATNAYAVDSLHASAAVELGKLLALDADANWPLETARRILYPQTGGEALTDGATHPLSDFFGTLGAAQAVYSCAVDLTDETAWCAIQQAINDSVYGDTIVIPSGVWRTHTTITCPSNRNLLMTGAISYAGAKDRAALIVGDTAASQNNDWALNVYAETPFVSTPLYTMSAADWTSEAYIGVQLVNAIDCRITIKQASNFCIGAQLLGKGTNGFGYNQIKLGDLSNNKIALDVTSSDYASVAGWCNQNFLLAGNFRVWVSGMSALDRWGVRITSQCGTPYRSNQNLFLHPCFELRSTTHGYPLLIEYGQLNRFESCRSEGNSTTKDGDVLNTSEYNMIDWGFGGVGISDTSVNPSTIQTFRKQMSNTVARRLVFDSGYLPETWCYYDGETTIHIPRCMWALYGDAVVYPSVTCTPAANYIPISVYGAIGVRVDTSRIKAFVLKRCTISAATGGRPLVRCYDAAGTLLTGTSPYYVTGTSALPFAAYANFGGSYWVQNTTDADIYMHFNAAVDHADIMLMGDAMLGGLALRSFSIWTWDSGHYTTSAYVPYEEIVPGSNIGTCAPTNVTGQAWAVGKRVWNAAPATAAPEGWICTVAGTPGTWKAFGVIA